MLHHPQFLRESEWAAIVSNLGLSKQESSVAAPADRFQDEHRDCGSSRFKSPYRKDLCHAHLHEITNRQQV